MAPQLTFNRDICPSRISFDVEWDQLTDIWRATVRCYSQVGQIQAHKTAQLLPTFEPRLLCFVYQAVLEDWLDLTPSVAAQTFERLINKVGR